jgi:hypothetical protein
MLAGRKILIADLIFLFLSCGLCLTREMHASIDIQRNKPQACSKSSLPGLS